MDGAEAAEPQAGALARVKVRAKRDYVRRAYCQKVAYVAKACRWIEAGWSLAEVCREPDMPLRSTFMAWLTAHPELRDMVEAARAVAAEVFTPRREYHRWDPAVAAEVLARIEDGRGLREVCSEPDMPSAATVTRWLRQREGFAAAYRLAREAQADRLFDLAWRIACDAVPGEVATARLKIQTLKWRVGRLAPRVYGPQRAVGVAGDREGGKPVRDEVEFYVRSFARTPDNQVVETSGATLGMSTADERRLSDDIREGRITLDELAALNAAGEARRNADDGARSRRGRRLRRV